MCFKNSIIVIYCGEIHRLATDAFQEGVGGKGEREAEVL